MIQVEVGTGLRHLGTLVEDEFSEAVDLTKPLLRDIWKDKALETRSYLSGDYYRNIHVSGQDILSDIGYGEIIESVGWGPGNPPRFPAEKAIEAASGDIEKILSDAAGRVIDRIEGG